MWECIRNGYTDTQIHRYTRAIDFIYIEMTSGMTTQYIMYVQGGSGGLLPREKIVLN